MINTLSASTCELVDEYSNSPVSDVQAENFYFQVKFINCYLREIISFTKKLTLETGASLILETVPPVCVHLWHHRYSFFFFICYIINMFTRSLKDRHMNCFASLSRLIYDSIFFVLSCYAISKFFVSLI